MKYSRLDKKKPYESPQLKLHTLRMEGQMLAGVTGEGHGQPLGAKKYNYIIDDSYTEQESTEYEYDGESLL